MSVNGLLSMKMKYVPWPSQSPAQKLIEHLQSVIWTDMLDRA